MAEFDLDFPVDFLKNLLETDFDEICEEALKETAPILERSIKNSLAAVIEHEGESELLTSIKGEKPRKTKNDAWIVNILFKGNSNTYYKSGKGKERKYKVSNVLKALWKEVGVAGRQPAKPFMKNAKNNAKKEIYERIQKVWEKKVGGK